MSIGYLLFVASCLSQDLLILLQVSCPTEQTSDFLGALAGFHQMSDSNQEILYPRHSQQRIER